MGTAHPEFLRKLRDVEHYRLDEARLLGGERRDAVVMRDPQHVNSYDGRLGCRRPTKKYKGAVGAMSSKNTPTGGKYCSGTLIGNDLFLTASHRVFFDGGALRRVWLRAQGRQARGGPAGVLQDQNGR